jgi:GNAT superfamily N-acetyltransferase
LRPATPDDRPFLLALHGATMRESVEAIWGWDDAVQERFFDNRFRPGVDQVIRVHSEDVGLLSIEDRPDELFLGLVQLAPAWQQRGIGTSILRRLLADASAAGKPFTLQVLGPTPPPSGSIVARGSRWSVRQPPTS